MDVIPAIIGKDFEEVDEKILSVKNFVDWVHVDIMDGVFTPSESWPYPSTQGGLAANWDILGSDIKKEVHLMVKNPERILSKWIGAGADRVLIHYEATDDENIRDILEELNSNELEAGIVLKYETPVEVVDKFIDEIDVVQLMSIAYIGAYGHPLEEGIYEKIERLRSRYPGVTISIDGGITLENAPKLKDAGADYLIAGSAIFKQKDIAKAISDFKNSL